MKKNKRILKRNNFRKSISLVFIALLLSLISYVILPSENEILNSIQTNTAFQTDSNIEIADIPTYSGQMVISINNDIPYFEDKDITIENFENYSKLDDIKRAGVAFAIYANIQCHLKEQKEEISHISLLVGSNIYMAKITVTTYMKDVI